MAYATGSLPWARCRTTGASAETRCAAAAAASPATATTESAGCAGPGAAAVRRRRGASLRSCAAPRLDVGATRGRFAHHHAAVQEQQQLGRRAVGGVGREQQRELVGLGADLVAMKSDAVDVIVGPAFGAAGGD